MATGMDTAEYKSVEKHMAELTDSLQVNQDARRSLIVQCQKNRWLALGAEPDAGTLVNRVLGRISGDANQYKIFIEMLNAIIGMDIICKKIEGII